MTGHQCPGDRTTPWCAEHTSYQTQRALDLSYAYRLGIRCVDGSEAARLLGRSSAPSGLLIPYPSAPGYHRLRLSDEGARSAGTRFLAPAGVSPPIYIAQPLHDGPIAIVEGPIKAAALACAGVQAIGLGGTATTLQQGTLGESWDALTLRGREVVVAMDAGRMKNPRVARDEARLTKALQDRTAMVRVSALPLRNGTDDQGPDDYLAVHGLTALVSVLDAARPADPVQLIEQLRAVHAASVGDVMAALLDDLPFLLSILVRGPSTQARVEDLFRKSKQVQHLKAALKVAAERLRDADGHGAGHAGDDPYFEEGGCTYIARGQTGVRLTNFTAQVTEELDLHDGVVSTKLITVEGKTSTGVALPPRSLKPADFLRDGWWLESPWGTQARVEAVAGATAHVRAMIMRRPTLARASGVAHGGWVEDQGRWCYVHANGCIGGSVRAELGSGVRCMLPELPGDVGRGIRSASAFFDCAVPAVTGPLIAAVFRSVVSHFLPPGFAIHLFGRSGTRKSALIKVARGFFGIGAAVPLFSWSSTAAAIERHVFDAKDRIVEVDDFAPGAGDGPALRAKFDRVIRSLGNSNARSRMTSTMDRRPEFPPRGLVISTGEDDSSRLSIMARLFVVPVSTTCVDVQALSAAQSVQDDLAIVTSHYVAWVAEHTEDVAERIVRLRDQRRSDLLRNASHGRTAEQTADLLVGLDLLDAFARTLPSSAQEELLAVGRAAASGVREAMASQMKGHVADENEVFLGMLRELIESGAAVLLRSGDTPGDSRAPVIGYFDEEFVYLIQSLTFAEVKKRFAEIGESHPYRLNTTFDRLEEAGYLGPGDAGRRTTRPHIGSGARPRCVPVRRARFQVAIPGERASGAGTGAQIPMGDAAMGGLVGGES